MSESSGRTPSSVVEALFALNAVLDDVLYGTYGVNSTSVEVHGRLVERLAPLTAPAREQSP